MPNGNQANNDGDAQGDVCDTDDDNDGVLDGAPDNDNCPFIANPNQQDVDADGIGDACDPLIDNDNDGVANNVDNCPFVANAPADATVDADGDGIGDACDNSEDSDGDNVADTIDNCPTIPNGNQANNDGDPQGDVCDPDDDNDGVLDDGAGDGEGTYTPCNHLQTAGCDDNCHFAANANQSDPWRPHR